VGGGERVGEWIWRRATPPPKMSLVRWREGGRLHGTVVFGGKRKNLGGRIWRWATPPPKMSLVRRRGGGRLHGTMVLGGEGEGIVVGE